MHQFLKGKDDCSLGAKISGKQNKFIKETAVKGVPVTHKDLKVPGLKIHIFLQILF